MQGESHYDKQFCSPYSSTTLQNQNQNYLKNKKCICGTQIIICTTKLGSSYSLADVISPFCDTSSTNVYIGTHL